MSSTTAEPEALGHKQGSRNRRGWVWASFGLVAVVGVTAWGAQRRPKDPCAKGRLHAQRWMQEIGNAAVVYKLDKQTMPTSIGALQDAGYLRDTETSPLISSFARPRGSPRGSKLLEQGIAGFSKAKPAF